MPKVDDRPAAHHHLILEPSLSLRLMELFALASPLRASPDVARSQRGQSGGILPGVMSCQGRGFARVPGSDASELQRSRQHRTFSP
ncbi:hypothetical protein GRJ2_001945400 [Grus japonensis]|uniref:Uncharacterized protein n=1 Tax=Grus japonensis TaxID=30415 RepID=A0ABC9XAV5_GRUJA